MGDNSLTAKLTRDIVLSAKGRPVASKVLRGVPKRGTVNVDLGDLGGWCDAVDSGRRLWPALPTEAVELASKIKIYDMKRWLKIEDAIKAAGKLGQVAGIGGLDLRNGGGVRFVDCMAMGAAGLRQSLLTYQGAALRAEVPFWFAYAFLPWLGIAARCAELDAKLGAHA
jgi:hypothetical protein